MSEAADVCGRPACAGLPACAGPCRALHSPCAALRPGCAGPCRAALAMQAARRPCAAFGECCPSGLARLAVMRAVIQMHPCLHTRAGKGLDPRMVACISSFICMEYMRQGAWLARCRDGSVPPLVSVLRHAAAALSLYAQGLLGKVSAPWMASDPLSSLKGTRGRASLLWCGLVRSLQGLDAWSPHQGPTGAPTFFLSGLKYIFGKSGT